MSSPTSPARTRDRRVDRRSADALRAAEQRLREARREADAIVARARADADRVRAEARTAGLEDARIQHGEWTARAVAEMKTWFEQAEARFVDRLKTCVEIILEHELSLRPESVVDTVRAATRDLRDALDLRVRVHPDDVPTVQDRIEALRSEQRAGATLRVCAEPELSRGTCRVESELGVIDGSLDGQVEALARAMTARAGATRPFSTP